ncbi:hypothetical protein [Sutterella sp.]|uniref:hypothetical protein n=1 Tax=Sutterella sp. TaxID=1981025 RepID=UPI0026DF03DE|nr:hypothetical protein [Sutterella sp.]MDO5531104.1 hypothetical protein [Sutterella sp.]
MQNIDANSIFASALGIHEPWFVSKYEFHPEPGLGKVLHIWIDFEASARFNCPAEGCVETELRVHGSSEHLWWHENFCDRGCYLHCRLPSVDCAQHGVHTVPAPWEGHVPGFRRIH